MKKVLGTALSLILIVLSAGCGAQNTPGNTARELTDGEIAEVNSKFEAILPLEHEEYDSMLNPVVHLLTSFYEKPQEMDFENFLLYFGTENMLDQAEISAEEFAKIKAHPAFPFPQTETLDAMPVPIHRKPLSEVNRVLEEYMGITAEELNTEHVVFLGEPYHAFYNYTSDAGFPVFVCTGGKVEGDTVILYSEHAALTLKKNREKYYIYSHLENK